MRHFFILFFILFATTSTGIAADNNAFETIEKRFYEFLTGGQAIDIGDPDRGAVAGDYIVTVSKIEVHDPKAGMSHEEASASRLEVVQTQVLPRIYQDRQNTPLSATVNRGRNKIDIELNSKP